jgi:phosphoribosylamine-glycine ligase
VATAGGDPGKVRSGDVIDGLDANPGIDVEVFHAGTAFDGQGHVVTAGGSVLVVCALGEASPPCAPARTALWMPFASAARSSGMTSLTASCSATR